MLSKTVKMIFLHLLLIFIPIIGIHAQTDAELANATVKALQLFEQERYAESIPYWEVLVKAMPDTAKIRFFYGFSLVAKSKQTDNIEEAKQLSAKALEQFKEAKRLGFNDPVNDQLIGMLSGEGGTDGGAGPSKNPEANKFMNQAENYFTQSKYDEALQFYQKALAIDPNIYEAALYSGDVYVQKQDWANAEIWYQKAIKINPSRETAYRYSATPLMKQKKYDEARDRYVEALITEPYSQMSPRGITQWAQATGAKLGHPKVDIPEFKYDANGKPTTTMSENSLGEGSKAWLAYSLTRDSWHKEKFTKTYPNEKKYRHTLQEEVEAIRSTLKSAKEQKLSHPHFEILQKLDDEGLLEAFILMAQADDGIAEDHEAYLKNNRPKLRQYVLNYVIHLEK